MTKTKTENDLDERFQWHKGLDPEHIFEEEMEMIKKLRARIPHLAKETDKFIACFLFARRHEVDETAALLKKFYQKKSDYEYLFPGHHIPSFKYFPFLIDNMIDGGGSMLHPKGLRDNKDRMVRYFIMGIDNPSGRTKEETYVALFWQAYYQITTEPLNAWRNGVGIIVDLKGAGLSNIDVSSKGREIHASLQGTFPFRIRALMVVNGNWVVKSLLTAAKLVLPKKLYNRIKLMDVPDLKNLLPDESLLEQYGGTAGKFTYVEYIKEIAETEEELFTRGIWRAPDGATPTS